MKKESKKCTSQNVTLQIARQKVCNMEAEYVTLHEQHARLQQQSQEIANKMIARKGAIDEFGKFIEEVGRDSMTNGKKKPAKKAAKKTVKKKKSAKKKRD
ncbi:MAG: hypothetical protein FVQ79_10875 [Planctomycetes bacterium]|nr:hypothetical protein [Planctomycetota bacterium]